MRIVLVRSTEGQQSPSEEQDAYCETAKSVRRK